MKCSKPVRPRRGKPLPLTPPERTSRVVYAEVPRHKIALYRFLFEGYDNLAIISVVDRYRAVIKVRFLADAEKDVRALLASQGARVLDLPVGQC